MKTKKSLALMILTILFASCGNDKEFFQMSPQEAKLITQPPFEFPAKDKSMKMLTDVDKGPDSFIPNQFKAQILEDENPEEKLQFVKACYPEHQREEYINAMKAFINDDSHTLFPVQYSFSTGKVLDDMAYFAHQRTILRKSDAGVSRMYVAPRHTLQYAAGEQAKHLVIEHETAKKDFIQGKTCHYNVVKMLEERKGEIRFGHAKKDDEGNIMRDSEGSILFFGEKANHRWKMLNYGDNYKLESECARYRTSMDILGFDRKMIQGEKVGRIECSYADQSLQKQCQACQRALMSPRLFFSPKDLKDYMVQKLVEYKILPEGSSINDLKALMDDQIELLPKMDITLTPSVYVADIREGSMLYKEALKKNDPTLILDDKNELPLSHKLLQPQISESSVRGMEYHYSVDQVFFLRNMIVHRTLLEDLLHDNRPVIYSHGIGEVELEGIDGAPQLIDNLIRNGLNGAVLSLQYTPIVLDLGRPGIRTSSLDWGSFFNLAGYGGDYIHRSAWLGGDIINLLQEEDSYRWSRVAMDGLLVLPDQNGKISSVRELFGNEIIINDKKYSNGFEALGALANKDKNDCDKDNLLAMESETLFSDEELKKRYLGPWDLEAYEKLKVWIDYNRNGVVDPMELTGLAQLGIGAINTCYYNAEKLAKDSEAQKDKDLFQGQIEDFFGNKTSLRTAFLFLGPDYDVLQKEAEILEMLRTGKMGDQDAPFRAAIDIYFKSNPLELVPRPNMEQMKTPGFFPSGVQSWIDQSGQSLEDLLGFRSFLSYGP